MAGKIFVHGKIAVVLFSGLQFWFLHQSCASASVFSSFLFGILSYYWLHEYASWFGSISNFPRESKCPTSLIQVFLFFLLPRSTYTVILIVLSRTYRASKRREYVRLVGIYDRPNRTDRYGNMLGKFFKLKSAMAYSINGRTAPTALTSLCYVYSCIFFFDVSPLNVFAPQLSNNGIISYTGNNTLSIRFFFSSLSKEASGIARCIGCRDEYMECVYVCVYMYTLMFRIRYFM